MKNIKIGIIGLGQRGYSMLKDSFLAFDDVEITAVCDKYPDRVERASAHVLEARGNKPLGFTDHHELLASGSVDAVYVATDWETHIEVACDAIETGIPVGLEVGGAYTIEECQKLVDTYEKTKTQFMLMENCCFGKSELLATSVTRAGLLGDIVHCAGAYAHDLRYEISHGNLIRHYRLRNYIARNTENYPTHELGPISKLMGLGCGNRAVSLVSMSSSALGIEQYINETKLYEEDPTLKGVHFNQGDIVTTLIKCAGGQTITLRLDTTLPRTYNREFTVRGTKGMYEQGCNMFFFDGDEESFNTTKYYREHIDNAKAFEAEYLPAAWRDMDTARTKFGHGGMDGITVRTFLDCVINGDPMPVDAYDAAFWMSVTPLAERSIAGGSIPVEFPDFTHGNWKTNPLRDVIPLK